MMKIIDKKKIFVKFAIIGQNGSQFLNEIRSMFSIMNGIQLHQNKFRWCIINEDLMMKFKSGIDCSSFDQSFGNKYILNACDFLYGEWYECVESAIHLMGTWFKLFGQICGANILFYCTAALCENLVKQQHQSFYIFFFTTNQNTVNFKQNKDFLFSVNKKKTKINGFQSKVLWTLFFV